MIYKRMMKHSLQIPIEIAALAGLALLAPAMSTPALAQTGPTQMTMHSGTMMWGMAAIHLLGIVVLILAAAAFIKYLFFR